MRMNLVAMLFVALGLLIPTASAGLHLGNPFKTCKDATGASCDYCDYTDDYYDSPTCWCRWGELCAVCSGDPWVYAYTPQDAILDCLGFGP